MSKRLSSLITTVGAVAVASGVLLAGGASGATSLPTLNVALTGTSGVSVSGSTESGAVTVVSTATDPGHQVAIVRLNPGVTFQQAIGAVRRQHGDPNALTPYGAIVFDAGAPSTTQTVLTPGDYAALNVTGTEPGGFAPFTVTQSPSPATLPAATATQTAIEFNFRGPTVLRDRTIVRTQNDGYLAHMIYGIGVRTVATARRMMALLVAGHDGKAERLSNGQSLGLAGPLSSGGMQQSVLQAKPGYYVEVCFMDTQDHREHTQLGMTRLIRVVQ